jgi:hypothetical protein
VAQSRGFFSAAGAPWADKVYRNDQGNPRAILYNAIVVLTEDPAVNDGSGHNSIRYDAFRRQTMLCARVPWDLNPVRIPRPWTDQDDREATSWLQDKGVLIPGMMLSKFWGTNVAIHAYIVPSVVYLK